MPGRDRLIGSAEMKETYEGWILPRMHKTDLQKGRSETDIVR